MKNSEFLQYKMKQKKEEEEWMDKLAEEEREKQYQKEQEKWLKEQAARIEMMKDVLNCLKKEKFWIGKLIIIMNNCVN